VVLLKNRELISAFVSMWLADKEQRIKEVVINCTSPIEIAVKWKYVTRSNNMSTEFLLDRLSKVLSRTELTKAAHDCLAQDTTFHIAIVRYAQLSSFFASVLSKDKLFSLVMDKDTRLSDASGMNTENARRCWGEYPKSFLAFIRDWTGHHKGKSLFQLRVPEYLMDRVWDEIERNIEAAAQIVLDDKNFNLIRKFECSIRCLLFQIRGCGSCVSSSVSFGMRDSSFRSESVIKRMHLVREILDKLSWNQFDVKQLKWSLEDLPSVLPVDYRDEIEVQVNWQCCLLHVCFDLFGEDETRNGADKRVSGDSECFWESAAREMRDGNLLHLAVQVGNTVGLSVLRGQAY